MSDKNRRRHFDASEWRNNQLAQRTIVALKQKNDRFAWEHAKDSKEHLLGYVWKCAQELQHTPQPEEIMNGMKDLPDRPNLRKIRSMMNATRAI